LNKIIGKRGNLIEKILNFFRLILSKKSDQHQKIPQKPSGESSSTKTEDTFLKPLQTRRKKKPRWDISQFNVPPAEGRTRFHDLNLPVCIMHAIADLKFQYCTPVQAEILPKAILGQDATGQAQTGTGKSAAFLITILTRIFHNPIRGNRRPGVPRALILAPTRELVLQIEQDAFSLEKYTRSLTLAVFGGMGYEKQKKILREKTVDIIVATPGRLIDFQQQKIIDLSRIEILIIDEADRMLDMGFISDIRQIISSTPPRGKRQTMFFSATISPEVERLASQWTKDSFSVAIEPETVAADSIHQVVYIVTSDEKFPLLYNLIKTHDRVLVFANRRDQARDLMEKLKTYNVSCDLLSGAVSQDKRIRVLDNFKSGKIRVLAATDVAARGIHVDEISLVINFNLPEDPEDYVHRIGRTGRAGSTGTSISFACEYDSFCIPGIEAFLKKPLPCEYPDAKLLEPPPEPVRKRQRPVSDLQKRRRTGAKTRRPYPPRKRKTPPPAKQ